MKIFLIIYFCLEAIWAIGKIGEKRKEITKDVAIFVVIFCGVVIFGITRLL